MTPGRVEVPVELPLPVGSRRDLAIVPFTDHTLPFQEAQVLPQLLDELFILVGVGVEDLDAGGRSRRTRTGHNWNRLLGGGEITAFFLAGVRIVQINSLQRIRQVDLVFPEPCVRLGGCQLSGLNRAFAGSPVDRLRNKNPFAVLGSVKNLIRRRIKIAVPHFARLCQLIKRDSFLSAIQQSTFDVILSITKAARRTLGDSTESFSKTVGPAFSLRRPPPKYHLV